ncbi:MAG: rRNA adenine N-6-methyltransferase family protein [Acidimicrobiia bacterium]
MARSQPRWGWHQLDHHAARHLVADASLPPAALVLDVGAGTGAITSPLVAAGHQVVAVELHGGRARHLEQRFGKQITVVRADASDLRLPRRPFHVVANPPYAITNALLRRLLHQGSRLQTAHLVLPDWAVHRWTSRGAPGAGRWAMDFVVRPGQRVPRQRFKPPPASDSQVLVIERRE